MLFDDENDSLSDLFTTSTTSPFNVQVGDNIPNSLSPTDQSWFDELLGLQPDQSSLNETTGKMHINNNYDELEEVQSPSLHVNDHSNRTTSMNPSGENTQSTTTGDEYLFAQEIDQVDFSNWYLDQLRNEFNSIAIYLRRDAIPIEYKRFIQACQQNPQNFLSLEGFSMFSSIIQHGQRLSQSNSQDSITGEQSDTVSNQNTSAPSDKNQDHTDEQLRELTQSNPPMPPKNDFSSLDLSKLLSEQLETIRGELLITSELLHPPNPYWHARTINCLAKNECAPLQSTIERQHIVLTWLNPKNINEKALFVHVKLLGYNGKTHPSKFIVPPETLVENIVTQSVLINKTYGCNLMNRTILFPLKKVKSDKEEVKSDKEEVKSDKEEVKSDKEEVKSDNDPDQIVLPVVMFNTFQTKKDPQPKPGSTTNDKANKIISDFVASEIEKICRLCITFCRLTNSGLLECVSKDIYTNFIRESKGTEELKPIDSSKITPIKPCACGDVDISVLLNTNSEKAGFIVIIDGRQLAIHEFNGVCQNTIVIHPPPKRPGVDGFDLIIGKLNVLKAIQKNHDPWDVEYLNKDKDILWNGRIKYAEPPCPGDHPHQSKEGRKRKRK